MQTPPPPAHVAPSLRVGRRPPEIQALGWIGVASAVGPLLAPRRGSVIVVAFLAQNRASRWMSNQLKRWAARGRSRGIVVLGVRTTPLESARSDSHGVEEEDPLPIARVTKQAFDSWGVVQTPALFVLDRDGIVYAIDIPVGRLETALAALAGPDEAARTQG